MKYLFIGISILIFSQHSFGQKWNDTKVSELSTLCKVWGLLKDYHPHIQKGKVNWDEVLLNSIPVVLDNSTTIEFNSLIDTLIGITGPVKPLKKSSGLIPDSSFINNLDFDWIDKDSLLSNMQSIYLKSVLQNYVPGKNVYIKNEVNKYYDMHGRNSYYDRQIENYDLSNYLLTIFRYWNAVNYFYSYKKTLEIPWENTLTKYISGVLEVGNAEDFYWLFARLNSELNDCHSFLENRFINEVISPVKSLTVWEFFPIRVGHVEGKTIIVEVADMLARDKNISAGDIILKINNIEIFAFRDSLRIYCGCSNNTTTDREINYALFSNFMVYRSNSILLSLEDSSGKIKEIEFDRVKYKKDRFSKQVNYESEYFGYFNMSDLTGSEFRKLYRENFNKNTIIIDLRNNTNLSLSAYIALRLPWTSKKPRAFAWYYKHDFKFPGTFRKSPSKMYYLGLRGFHKKYKGNVFVLVNENVQSSSEFELMSLRHSFNITIIGSNTSGTDGATSSFLAQSDILTYFTTDAVFFPDGSPQHGIGITPDVFVLPSIKSIREGKDNVLEYAIQLSKSTDSL